MSKIGLLIVDDHLVVRDGLRGMLKSQPDFEVLGEASDGEEALRLAITLEPAVILMDLRMPVMDGVTATREIKARCPEAHILVLTTYDSDADILPAIEAGATGYLLKDVTSIKDYYSESVILTEHLHPGDIKYLFFLARASDKFRIFFRLLSSLNKRYLLVFLNLLYRINIMNFIRKKIFSRQRT